MGVVTQKLSEPFADNSKCPRAPLAAFKPRGMQLCDALSSTRRGMLRASLVASRGTSTRSVPRVGVLFVLALCWGTQRNQATQPSPQGHEKM
jgi:hypothetical protein